MKKFVGVGRSRSFKIKSMAVAARFDQELDQVLLEILDQQIFAEAEHSDHTDPSVITSPRWELEKHVSA